MSGLFGKLPGHADFVRIGLVDAECLAVASWISSAVDATYQHEKAPLTEPARFFLRTPGSKAARIGVLQPSQDSVGRKFPVSIFTRWTVPAEVSTLAGVATAGASFFAQASVLLKEAGSLDGQELESRLAGLPGVSEDELVLADLGSLLCETRVQAFTERLFETSPQGQHYYGYYTLASGCALPAGQGNPKEVGITFDCPCESELDQMVWLLMVEGLVANATHPSLILWTSANESVNNSDSVTDVVNIKQRLLIGFGVPSTLALVYLGDVKNNSSKLWPLQTDNTRAIDWARDKLTPSQRQAIDGPDTYFDTLLQTLAKR